MAEFLPLCDVLFNVISLAGYFCDVVFDVVLSYALFEHGRFAYMAVVISLVMVSLIISQIVSLRWYLNKIGPKASDSMPATDSIDKKKPINTTVDSSTASSTEMKIPSKIGRYCVIALHCCQLGVLWRYAKLFVPVDLRHVKHEVRDLCMLRLVHAFCEAAPMLLLQLYILVTIQKEEGILLKPEITLQSLGSGHVAPVIVQQPTIVQQYQLRTFKDLNVVSCALSLFSVCWALASFSKNVRIQNVHRLVLTWLGVIFQFLWRLGTVISRVASLTVYASVYGHWVFMVIALHWISMFLWLISPKNVFHGERITRVKKAALAGLIAFVYVFAYINLQEVNHRQKMLTFYIVMFLENSLLVFLWLIGVWMDKPENWYMTPIWILVSFATGILFMFLYYRYFHVRRLRYEAGGRLPLDTHSKYSCPDGTSCIAADDNLNAQKYPSQIPGVFNCRFSNPMVGNGAARRKKKKPTSFVLPPNLQQSISNGLPNSNICATANSGPTSIPFWRRPISRSQTGGSENEGSAGSRVNIYQKLQEKKQKQLAELKIIEEEIKQGKLNGPLNTNRHGLDDESTASLPRQPIPHVKKHINIDPHEWRTSSPEMCVDGTTNCLFNDLNVISPSNDINNLNKFTRNYDPLYNSFALNAANIPALKAIENNQRNMSPIPSQISAAESNSMTRQIVPRSKIPHNGPRNLNFTETYHSNFPNVFADNNFNNSNERAQSSNVRNAANSPSRLVAGTHSANDDNGMNKIHNDNNNNQNHLSVSQQQRLHLQRQMQRAKTPEILLAPHYLDNARVYYDWRDREQPAYRMKLSNNGQKQQQQQPPQQHHVISSGDENLDDHDDSVLGIGPTGYRIPSDIDSQVSLPRSYTLPREFKYYRRNKGRKLYKNEHFITSTNSSDGDVDSGDDNESERHSNSSQQFRLQAQPAIRKTEQYPSPAQNKVPPIRNQYLHCAISASATTSPVTVTNIYEKFTAKEINKMKASPSPLLMNNLHMDAMNVAAGPSNSKNGSMDNVVSRETSMSPSISLNMPNYLNRMPNGAANRLAVANGCGVMSGTLDLISGVESPTTVTALNRQMRLRAYSNYKNGGVRHETKL